MFAKTYEEEHEARSINILEKMYNEERVSFDGEDFEQIRECIDPKYFNALIRSETMKALSGFLDKSPYKKIIKILNENNFNNEAVQTRLL